MASSSAALAVLMLSWAAALAAASSPVTFEAGYMPLFGGGNLVPSPGGRSVRLKLDRHTGKTYRRKNPLQLPSYLATASPLFKFVSSSSSSPFEFLLVASC